MRSIDVSSHPTTTQLHNTTEVEILHFRCVVSCDVVFRFRISKLFLRKTATLAYDREVSLKRNLCTDLR